LFKETDINILHLYKIADGTNKGYLTLLELWELFTSMNIKFDQESLIKYKKALIKRPIMNMSSRINFADFMANFTPINQSNQACMFNSFIWSQEAAKNATITERSTDMMQMIIDLRRKLYKEISSSVSSISYVSCRAIYKEITRGKSAGGISWEDMSTYLTNLDIKFFTTDIMYVFREFGSDSYKVIDENAYLDFFKTFDGLF
jgi:Ca2+-binding EF-hand superfamily protein